MPRRRNLLVLATSAALLVSGAAVGTAAADPSSWWGHGGRTPTINGFKNVVVIYEENHSFDNLYGSWGVSGRAIWRSLVALFGVPTAHLPVRTSARRSCHLRQRADGAIATPNNSTNLRQIIRPEAAT